MDGKKLVGAAKWAGEHDGPGECEGCPLKSSSDCIVLEKLEATEPNVLACEVADAILAAYEWGRIEEFRRHISLKEAAEHVWAVAMPDKDDPAMVCHVATDVIEALCRAVSEVEEV